MPMLPGGVYVSDEGVSIGSQAYADQFSDKYDSQDDCEEAAHTGNPTTSFNPVSGLASYFSNIWAAMAEAAFQQEWNPKPTPVTTDFEYSTKPPGGGEFADPPSKLPPSYTYDGPIAGAGFLGLFPPAPGSPKYNDYVNRNNFKVETEMPPEEPSSSLNQVSKWGGNVGNSWNDFTKGVFEGYNEEKGHEWYDLIPGFSKSTKWPPLLILGGGILLLILIIK